VKLAVEAEFIFWSKVAEMSAATLTELSLGSGKTLSTTGGLGGFEEDSSPVPLHARTPNTQQIAAIANQRTFFNSHHLSLEKTVRAKSR